MYLALNIDRQGGGKKQVCSYIFFYPKLSRIKKKENVITLFQIWDDELATVAQAHADQCEFEHDCSDCRRVDR